MKNYFEFLIKECIIKGVIKINAEVIIYEGTYEYTVRRSYD